MPTLDQKDIEKNSYIKRYNYLDGLVYAVKSCYMIASINLSFMVDILKGKMSASNLGGPIAIAKGSSDALHGGFKKFIDFLALISIGLGIMNLLPLPVLDGGHIVIYAIELVIGREVSHSVQMLIFKIGFILILGVSLFAIYNDILRL